MQITGPMKLSSLRTTDDAYRRLMLVRCASHLSRAHRRKGWTFYISPETCRRTSERAQRPCSIQVFRVRGTRAGYLSLAECQRDQDQVPQVRQDRDKEIEMTSAIIKCRQCKWDETVGLYKLYEEGYLGNFRSGLSTLPDLLKSAWSIGLEHAWDNRGHIVETFVDGKLKATQQVADMSPWVDHNTVIVEEGIE